MSSSLATLFVDFSNFLLVLNCSTNFWVFFFWGKRFRRSCTYLFATSFFGRAMNKWMRVAVDSEFANYFSLGLPPGGSSFTNCTKSRSRCGSALYTDILAGNNKRAMMPNDSTAASLLFISNHLAKRDGWSRGVVAAGLPSPVDASPMATWDWVCLTGGLQSPLQNLARVGTREKAHPLR